MLKCTFNIITYYAEYTVVTIVSTLNTYKEIGELLYYRW